MCKKYFLVKSIIALMLMMAFACQKDDQSFTYDAINNVQIESSTATEQAVFALDTLKITPKIVEPIPSGEEFDYQWTLLPVITTSKTSPQIIATTRNLNVRMDQTPGSYTLIFKMTSKKTGVAGIARFAIKINGAFFSGWYVVNNKGVSPNLSFIRTDNTIYQNPIEAVNKKTYTGKGLSAYYSSTINSIFFFTDQSAYRFNPNDLFELSDMVGTLPGFTTLPFKAAPYYVATQLDQFIVADGGIYAGFGASTYPSEILKPFSERLPGSYDVFPGAFTGNILSTMFYDNNGMRFIQVNYNTRAIILSPATTGSFNLANVGKKMIAFDKASGTVFYYVMEDNTGRYLLSTSGSTPGFNQLITNSSEINLATDFAVSTLLKQMYYVVNNKIYLYDMLANSSRLLYSFPADYLIKDIEMQRVVAPDKIEKLVVGTNKGTAGEVYFFDIDLTGGFTGNTFSKKYDGFGDITKLARR
jgi:hypothetical protein